MSDVTNDSSDEQGSEYVPTSDSDSDSDDDVGGNEGVNAAGVVRVLRRSRRQQGENPEFEKTPFDRGFHRPKHVFPEKHVEQRQKRLDAIEALKAEERAKKKKKEKEAKKAKEDAENLAGNIIKYGRLPAHRRRNVIVKNSQRPDAVRKFERTLRVKAAMARMKRRAKLEEERKAWQKKFDVGYKEAMKVLHDWCCNSEPVVD